MVHTRKYFSTGAIAGLWVVLSLLTAVGQANATTITVTYTLGQGKLEWNGKEVGDGCKCTPHGDNCKIKITITNVVHVSDGGTVWTFDGNVPSATAEIDRGDGSTFDATIPGANMPFPDGSHIDVPANAFPGIPEFHISLDNVVCDANGNFSGSVPK
jgi:hypothetical protein